MMIIIINTQAVNKICMTKLSMLIRRSSLHMTAISLCHFFLHCSRFASVL